MGERIVITLLDASKKEVEHLYNHWGGLRRVFFSMITTTYLKHKPKTVRDWAEALMANWGDTIRTEFNDDKNYLGVIDVENGVVLWVRFPLDPEYDELDVKVRTRLNELMQKFKERSVTAYTIALELKKHEYDPILIHFEDLKEHTIQLLEMELKLLARFKEDRMVERIYEGYSKILEEIKAL